MTSARLSASVLAAWACVSAAAACSNGDGGALVGDGDTVTLASGYGIWPGPGFAIDRDRFVATAVRDERVLGMSSDVPWRFDRGTSLSPSATVGSVTGLVRAGAPTVYLAPGRAGSPGLRVARLEADALVDARDVVLDGPTSHAWWPQAAALPDGRTLLAFVEPQKRIYVGVDDGTGTRFRVDELHVSDVDLQGVLASVAVTAAGAWVVAYQVADASWRFRSYVVLSHDEGATWTAPVSISPEDDVSDPFPIARRDGGVDVYFTAPVRTGRQFFVLPGRTDTSVWRRALRDDGTFGPAQVVTDDSLGDAASPQPRRLADGRIALLMLTDYHPGKQRDLTFAVLDGDAPAP